MAKWKQNDFLGFGCGEEDKSIDRGDRAKAKSKIVIIFIKSNIIGIIYHFLPPQHLFPLFEFGFCSIENFDYRSILGSNSSRIGMYFSVPIFIPGCYFNSTMFCSILFSVVSVNIVKISSTFVPVLADVSINGMLCSFAKRRPSSNATFLLHY